MIAAIFAEVLGLPRVGALDNFFAIGGDSLRAAQVLSRVEARTGAQMEMLSLFKAPTVDRLAERMRAALREGHRLDQPPLVTPRHRRPSA
jgi:acyl carrier protein